MLKMQNGFVERIRMTMENGKLHSHLHVRCSPTTYRRFPRNVAKFDIDHSRRIVASIHFPICFQCIPVEISHQLIWEGGCDSVDFYLGDAYSM